MASVSRPASRPNFDGLDLGLGLGYPCLGLGLGGPGQGWRSRGPASVSRLTRDLILMASVMVSDAHVSVSVLVIVDLYFHSYIISLIVTSKQEFVLFDQYKKLV